MAAAPTAGWMTSRPSVRRGGRRLTARAAALVALAGALIASMTSCAPPVLTISVVTSGLNRPWDIAFTPDGTMLFTQKDGRISARTGGANVLIVDPVDSIVAGEGGMMGLAVDPQFATNRYIYACFLSNATDPVNNVRDVRVVRFGVAADYASVTSRADIVTGMPYSTGRHSGCRPRFGPDERLFVGTGDAAVGTHPQDRNSLGGKVLRVDRDGNGVPGNPGVDDPGSGFREEIYTYGHRNVQGIAVRYGTLVYSIEHGSYRDDEVNLLEAGGNYGWDPVPGYNETVPMTDTVKFPDAKPAVWSSGNPTIAPSGGTFVSGNNWDLFENNLLMAVLKDMQVRVVLIDGSNVVVAGQGVAIDGQGRLRSAVQGPDGAVYLAQDANPGSILRLEASRAS